MSKKRSGSYFDVGKRRRKKNFMMLVPVIAAVVAISIAIAVFYNPTPVQAINGIQCQSGEMLQYHIHSHLNVLVNGQEQQVPGGIGIVTSPSTCFYWIHTHTIDGIIHMESPQPMTFTLGQFIQIWKQTKADSQTMFNTASELPVKAYVNGQEFSGDPTSIKLQSQEQIVLVYGYPPSTIPSYDFKGLT